MMRTTLTFEKSKTKQETVMTILPGTTHNLIWKVLSMCSC